MITALLAAAPRPTWNLIHDGRQVLHYPFMQHSFTAGTIVAVLAGVVGYFVVLRQSSFAAHAVSEMGFAGASGGVAFGFSAVYGLLGMSLLGALVIGLLGKRLRGRDAAIGSVLAFSLGLGSYFLTLYKGNASGAFGLLFGQIFGIGVRDIWVIAVAGVVTLATVAVVYRPLLFASLDPDVAEARGVPVQALSIGFFVIVALAVTAAVQVVGVLLIFSLLVLPAALADRLCRTPSRAIALGVASSLLFVWAGLIVAFYTKFPVGFLITTYGFVAYLLVRLVPVVARTGWLRLGRGSAPAPDPVPATATATIPPPAPSS